MPFGIPFHDNTKTVKLQDFSALGDRWYANFVVAIIRFLTYKRSIKHGLVNQQDELVVPCEYDSAEAAYMSLQ